VQAVGQAPGKRARPVVTGLRGARERVRPDAGPLVPCLRRALATQAERVGHPVHRDAAEIAEYIQRQIATGRFPHLEKLTHDPAAQNLADPGRLDERFERGLRALLDGAAADAGDQ